MPQAGKNKRESAAQADAFELYYFMGDSRSTEKLAAVMGREPGTMQKWAASFNWKRRVQERDERLKREFANRNEEMILVTKRRMLNLIERSLRSAAKYYEDGLSVQATKIKALSPGDLEKLTKSLVLLTGSEGAIRIPKDTKFTLEFV